MIASSALVSIGLVLLFGDPWVVAAGLIVYGAGNGLTSIVRGTLPLVLFGAEGYATLMGVLGRPMMIAFATTPFLAAVILDHYGATVLLATLIGIVATNIVRSEEHTSELQSLIRNT